LLIVDDEAAQMKALCHTLEDEGYAATGFTSADDALKALRPDEFDLVLTDLQMPEMDGITLLRAAQEIDRSLLGIVMTGHGAIDTAVEAMKAGALDYILKPFKLSAILPVLSRALAVRRLRIENALLHQRVTERTIELEAANQELEAFSFSVSHDLRAPLRHINGYAEILMKEIGDTLDDRSLRHLKTISGTAGQMQQLIDSLLDFSRLARAGVNHSTVDLDFLLQDTIAGLETETANRNIVWKKGPLPSVQGDPFLLKQVFVNLLSNAIKYTRPRDPARIEIECVDEAADEVVISIRDNGVGFDMAYAAKLFGVFQRLHQANEFEGTGIGLANVQRIIARHGGRVWAESVLNEGAKFSFALKKTPRGCQPFVQSKESVREA
jgi:signal transduction histidine kinase